MFWEIRIWQSRPSALVLGPSTAIGNSGGARRTTRSRSRPFIARSNWIDTAAVYGLGHSEEVVARALQEWEGPRPYVFTKCGMIWNAQGKVDYSLRQESIRRECEASLRRLKMDVIDLYQIHWTSDDLNETVEGWTTLLALQKEGKVRWIG